MSEILHTILWNSHALSAEDPRSTKEYKHNTLTSTYILPLVSPHTCTHTQIHTYTDIHAHRHIHAQIHTLNCDAHVHWYVHTCPCSAKRENPFVMHGLRNLTSKWKKKQLLMCCITFGDVYMHVHAYIHGVVCNEIVNNTWTGFL